MWTGSGIRTLHHHCFTCWPQCHGCRWACPLLFWTGQVWSPAVFHHWHVIHLLSHQSTDLFGQTRNIPERWQQLIYSSPLRKTGTSCMYSFLTSDKTRIKCGNILDRYVHEKSFLIKFGLNVRQNESEKPDSGLMCGFSKDKWLDIRQLTETSTTLSICRHDTPLCDYLCGAWTRTRTRCCGNNVSPLSGLTAHIV